MGEQEDPDSSTDYLCPVVTPFNGGWVANSLEDYFGLPLGLEDLEITSFHHRAYNLIWNEWFRDQNLQESVNNPTNDGPDLPSNYTLLRRGKRHDYFTSCLPWPQKGPGVELPLGDSAPINYDNATGTPATNIVNVYSTADSALRDLEDGSNGVYVTGSLTGSASDSLYADLSNATASTINSLRQAFQLQKLYERDARGGTRYTEIVRSHFNVRSPDARMQRPEYLGGTSSPLTVDPVPRTDSSAGELQAVGTVVSSGRGFVKSFTEHCVILGLVSVRADLTYQDGIPRMFSRRDRFDFYWPSLSHLGEQAVLNKEIYAQNTSADDEVFGYQERWAEYRYFPSKITGVLRSNHPQSLDVWHLSQDFSALPTLNSTFIQEDPPFDRVVTVVDEPHFILDSFIDLKCARPMPVYSVPGMIDHF